MNKFPIYVISKGRADLKHHTAKFLIEDGIDFKIVVEPQEFDKYSERFGGQRLLVLPFSNLGLGSIPARNWCWEHAKETGHKRHWIIDDNIKQMRTYKDGKRTRCDSKIGFQKCEEFVERYENIAIAGINYSMFGFNVDRKLKPFFLNTRAYSTILILNSLPFRWRGRYNEDTDLCLQALTRDWCTVNINTFLMDKAQTMTCKGGNMAELYKGRGRLKMARSLEYQWLKYPGLVKTTYRYERPQHHVKWDYFKTRLKKIGVTDDSQRAQPEASNTDQSSIGAP